MIPSPGHSDDHGVRARTILPPLLSFVSGFVDTVGFLGLFGLLTSQVTGAFIAAGAAFVQKDSGLVPKVLAIPMFMVGAALMTVLVALLRRRRRDPLPIALSLVAGLIGLFLMAAVTGGRFSGPDSTNALVAAILACLAMGAESALVRVLFKGSVPANFMTGNVTQVAVEVTELVLASTRVLSAGDLAADGERVSAARRQLRVLLPMIGCFMAGALAAAHAFVLVGFWSLLLATGLVAAAAIWSRSPGSALAA